MYRRTTLAAATLLGAFHAWLLGAQAWSGQLAQPDVLGRWIAAFALAAGLTALARRGSPLVFGRRAVAIWVLAAVLHGPALANDLDGFATPALPEAVTSVAQIAGALSAVALALLIVLRSASSSLSAAGVIDARGRRVWPFRTLAAPLSFHPRPPPLV
jgi:hypothetical protein